MTNENIELERGKGYEKNKKDTHMSLNIFNDLYRIFDAE